jgi:hypothetical protein
MSVLYKSLELAGFFRKFYIKPVFIENLSFWVSNILF